MHGCFACLHACAPHVWLSPWEPKWGVGAPGTEVTDGCNLLCGCWELAPTEEIKVKFLISPCHKKHLQILVWRFLPHIWYRSCGGWVDSMKSFSEKSFPFLHISPADWWTLQNYKIPNLLEAFCDESSFNPSILKRKIRERKEKLRTSQEHVWTEEERKGAVRSGWWWAHLWWAGRKVMLSVGTEH